MDTTAQRDELEARISVAMDLSEKALASVTIAWKEQEAIGLLSYARVALNRAHDLLDSAESICTATRVKLREEEARAEGLERSAT